MLLEILCYIVIKGVFLLHVLMPLLHAIMLQLVTPDNV